MLPRPSGTVQARPDSVPLGTDNSLPNRALKRGRHDFLDSNTPAADGAQESSQLATSFPSVRPTAVPSAAPPTSVPRPSSQSTVDFARTCSAEAQQACFATYERMELSEELFDELELFADHASHPVIYKILKRLQTAASEFFRLVREKQRHEYALADLGDGENLASSENRDVVKGERGGSHSEVDRRKEDLAASDLSVGKEHAVARERFQAYIQHFLPRFLKLGVHPVPLIKHFFLQFVARLMHMDGRGVPACLISINDCMSSAKGKSRDLANVFCQALDVLRRLWKTILCYSSLGAARLRRYGSPGVQVLLSDQYLPMLETVGHTPMLAHEPLPTTLSCGDTSAYIRAHLEIRLAQKKYACTSLADAG